MAKSAQETVFEGWLTKSPPSKRIWRARWRRRWFLLTNSGELPGQYILTYYTDRNCRQKKGVINLDQCEQVDLGLKLDERKLKFDHVFDIKTPSRTYYLAADTETEMKNWVTCICKVCGLKSTNDEDEARISTGDIEITEESSDNNRRATTMNNFNDTPPVSPVSTSPYIPIFECITGKSPVFDPKDFKTLMEYNKKNSLSNTDNLPNGVMQTNNETYELTQRRNSHLTYINLPNDPRFYDCPRKLAPYHPQQIGQKLNEHEYMNIIENNKNHSPLRSPTDSDSVFNDEQWTNNTSSNLNSSKNTRPSDSSADEGIIATQRFTKVTTATTLKVPPPRPPKPSQRSPAPCYLNLTGLNTKDSEESEHEKPAKDSSQPTQQKVLTDDMYDFPRSHHIESEATLKRKHCYNNAAPVLCPEGTIFKYDISPKPGTSTIAFRYDVEDLSQNVVEPPSPAHSHSSSTPAYSNLPSPLLASTQLMPAPAVNRGLKPSRKLSDSHSISSNPEPSSPRYITGPSVDRKLKPPTPIQDPNLRKYFTTDDDPRRRYRAAPSPTPPNLGHSHDSLLNKNENGRMYHYLTGKMQYLDLDLENMSLSSNKFPLKNQQTTVYKEVDFMKTHALNITRSLLEKERQEPPKKKE